MEAKKLKWKRSNNPTRLILQKRDREIITSVYSFRLLTRQQLQQLFHISSIRRINQRLKKLYDHKYLSRFFLPTIRGSGKALYYLGPRGVAIVADETGIDLNLLKNKRKSTAQLQELFLHHTLGLNDFRIAFYLSLQNYPDITLERWINDNDCHQQFTKNVGGKNLIKQFRPDGYFRLIYNGKLHSFFVEYDRSTMSHRRFNGKVQSYLDFHSLGYYRKQFGVQFFRVLVVTKTDERLINLKKTVGPLTDKIFLFTTVDEVTPDTVLGPIWKRVGNYPDLSLIEL